MYSYNSCGDEVVLANLLMTPQTVSASPGQVLQVVAKIAEGQRVLFPDHKEPQSFLRFEEAEL